ncbi:MAG: 4-hydroxy-3-methylbut-2-enyl diphosphate reductase [Candidatus Ratteibacteria bacterium]|nr:4-hydroxy-3-methylbut-2-enyl diphosphate reductase [Candidatus Ratteibacteria bacterium]
MKKLLVARNIGFCFGVQRTVEIAKRLLLHYRELYSIGDIVHNPLVMEDLKSKGLKVVRSKDGIEGGRFIVRSHGIGPTTLYSLKKKGLEIFDATCPSVKKIQALIKKLDKEKYFIIIIGNEKHPEVMGLQEYGTRTLILGKDGEPPALKTLDKIAIIGQTTLSFEEYIRKAGYIAEMPFSRKVVIYNTICKVTGERQKEAAEIGREADAVCVLGGRNSSNTTKLYETVKRYNRNVFYIERMEDIEDIPFLRFNSIGLISGTSTPEDFIAEVKKRIKKTGYREVQYNGK